jgi:uncharacterized protein
MKTEGLDELGIGVVYTPRLARVLDLSLVDVLEIEPQMFWRTTDNSDIPICVDLELYSKLSAASQHKLVHSVTLPIGNSLPHDPSELELLKQSIATLDAPYASEHLSFNQFHVGSERLWTGFLLPPKQDLHGVKVAATRIDEMRRAVNVPVAFETGVNYLRPQPDELSDGCFVRSVAEAADCGILLDLHNLLTNERNGRESVRAVFSEIPHERVWEIHLAGGMEYRGFWLDSHSSHIEENLFLMAREIVDDCPNLRAIVFELMDEYVDERSRDALYKDVQRLRSLWHERRRSRFVSAPPLRDRHVNSEAPLLKTVLCRENTLGALALGQVPRDPEQSVVRDPAAVLYADLVAAMREGVLHQTLPFLIRLLFVSIGPQATMETIAAFRHSAPPRLFGADEARQFIAFVRALTLQVPHLSEILNFQDALIAVAGTLEKRTVIFDCDPEPLFDALMQRRSPGFLPRQCFYLDVSANGIESCH